MNDNTENMTNAEITDALNRVHDPRTRITLDAALARLQWLSLEREEW